MDYLDFSIRITADGADSYRVEAVCPAGEAIEEFIAPCAPQGLASSPGDPLFEGSWRNLGLQEGGQSIAAEVIGCRLFQSLMPFPVCSLFDATLGKAKERDRGVRIKLRIDPTDSRVSWLGLAPWEAMYRPDRCEFLGLSRSTPISRYLDAPHPVSPPPFAAPLRILAAWARPQDTVWLDHAQEHLDLQQSWGDGPGIEIESLGRATPDALRDRFCQRWDILHFMGHGGFDEDLREGFLVFEDDTGQSQRMSDRCLAILLQGAQRPRLVVLNACETARTALAGQPKTATGAAPMLVRAGIPAVAAMLHPVSDGAALLFNRALHQRLAAGDPIDVAVAEGRRAIYTSAQSTEWLTPIAFMRIPDGRIFQEAQPDQTSLVSTQSPAAATLHGKDVAIDNMIIGGVVTQGDCGLPDPAAGSVDFHADTLRGKQMILGGRVCLKETPEAK
jgi:hypothetical protein